MSFDVVSAYTLLVGDGDGPPSVSVHSTADEAWRTLEINLHRRVAQQADAQRYGDQGDEEDEEQERSPEQGTQPTQLAGLQDARRSKNDSVGHVRTIPAKGCE